MWFWTFKKQKPNKKFNYKKPSEIGKKTNFDDIPNVDVPKTGTNIIILDDNVCAGKITKKEIIFLLSIGEKLEFGLDVLNENEKTFISGLTNNELTILNDTRKYIFNIILFTGDQAAFSLIESIKRNDKIDIAILDIIIGGYNLYEGKGIVLDGIDISFNLKDKKFKFYSGCSLDRDSTEFSKFWEYFQEDINEYTIIKNNNSNYRLKEIIRLIGQSYENI